MTLIKSNFSQKGLRLLNFNHGILLNFIFHEFFFQILRELKDKLRIKSRFRLIVSSVFEFQNEKFFNFYERQKVNIRFRWFNGKKINNRKKFANSYFWKFSVLKLYYFTEDWKWVNKPTSYVINLHVSALRIKSSLHNPSFWTVLFHRLESTTRWFYD